MSDRQSDNLHYVTDAESFEETDRVVIDIKGREIGIFKVDGEFYALANYCTHQGGPVCEGQISGMVTTDKNEELTFEKDQELVACPWHGWQFDITSGQHVASKYRLPTYEVVVKDGDVYVKA